MNLRNMSKVSTFWLHPDIDFDIDFPINTTLLEENNEYTIGNAFNLIAVVANTSVKYREIVADKLRDIADDIESGDIPLNAFAYAYDETDTISDSDIENMDWSQIEDKKKKKK